jgi:hypothetical protein
MRLHAHSDQAVPGVPARVSPRNAGFFMPEKII